MTRFTSSTNKTEKTAKTEGKLKSITRTKHEQQPPEEHLGLCTTCIHTETCTFRRDVSQAVLECDEFDIGQTAEPEARVEAAQGNAEAKVEFKGLCVNCDSRTSCTFPKPAEGIWHCEEYL